MPLGYRVDTTLAGKYGLGLEKTAKNHQIEVRMTEKWESSFSNSHHTQLICTEVYILICFDTAEH